MAKQAWIFLRNPIESVTARSNRKMDSLSADHDLKLSIDSTDPIIGPIYTTFHPLRTAYHSSYVAYKAALNDSQGSTLALQNMWKSASAEKFDEWDSGVSAVYNRTTPEHKSLFPNGHEPFRVSGYEERISHIQALSTNLGNYPALSAVKTKVDTFLTDYDALNVSVVSKRNLIKTKSADLKVKKKDCAAAMYSDLGYLMYKYPTSPDTIAKYFDVASIVRCTPKSDGGDSTELTIAVPVGETPVEAGFVFTDETKIHVYNSGDADLQLFTAADKHNVQIPEDALIVHPEEEKDIVMYTLGITGNRYFFIVNKGTEDGEIAIDLVS